MSTQSPAAASLAPPGAVMAHQRGPGRLRHGESPSKKSAGQRAVNIYPVFIDQGALTHSSRTTGRVHPPASAGGRKKKKNVKNSCASVTRVGAPPALPGAPAPGAGTPCPAPRFGQPQLLGGRTFCSPQPPGPFAAVPRLPGVCSRPGTAPRHPVLPRPPFGAAASARQRWAELQD